MSIEQAREAMESGISNDSSGSSESSGSDTTNQSDISSKESSNQDIDKILELDGLEKFKYKGRELSLKDLETWEKGHMMQSDYTKKTQAISEERKYYDNLAVDLQSVRNNPALKSEFMKIYPEKFHSYLDFLNGVNNQQAQTHQVEQNKSLDPEIMDRLSKVDQIESYIKEQEVQAIDAKLDVIFKKMAEKYPMADEERVLAMAQSLHNQGTKLDDQMWDKIWGHIHGKTEEMFKTYQKNIVSKQQEASRNARDASGRGGGMPGQAPKRMSFKDATEAAIRDLTNR